MLLTTIAVVLLCAGVIANVLSVMGSRHNESWKGFTLSLTFIIVLCLLIGFFIGAELQETRYHTLYDQLYEHHVDYHHVDPTIRH